jgi:putative transposase
MSTAAPANPYTHHRFPAEISSHGAWWYFRFYLSDRNVAELLCARGILVACEATRQWCRTFGQAYAPQRRRPQPGDTWPLEEVFLSISGERHDLWRAVDQDGTVLDILVQCRRNTTTAKTFVRKLLKRWQYVPRVIITDQRKNSGAAKREMLPGVDHRQHRSLNHRAEHSHQPTRQRERRMPGFKSPGHAQRFLSAYGPIAPHVRLRRHRLSASAYRQDMRHRFERWAEIAGTERAAERVGRIEVAYPCA